MKSLIGINKERLSEEYYHTRAGLRKGIVYNEYERVENNERNRYKASFKIMANSKEIPKNSSLTQT